MDAIISFIPKPVYIICIYLYICIISNMLVIYSGAYGRQIVYRTLAQAIVSPLVLLNIFFLNVVYFYFRLELKTFFKTLKLKYSEYSLLNIKVALSSVMRSKLRNKKSHDCKITDCLSLMSDFLLLILRSLNFCCQISDFLFRNLECNSQVKK